MKNAALLDGFTANDTYLARLVIISFFLPQRLQVFVLLGVCLFWVVRDLRRAEKIQPRQYSPAFLLSSLYLLYLAYLPFTGSSYRSEGFFILEQKASLLVVPFAIASLRPQTRKIIFDELVYFVYACLIACLLGNIGYLLLFGWNNTHPLSNMQYRGAFEDVTAIHPTYMGMYICFAIGILLWSPTAQQALSGWKKGAVFFALIVFIMALMPKTPLVALVIIFLYYGWLNRSRKRKLALILAVPALAAALAFTFLPFPAQRIQQFTAFLNPSPKDDPEYNSFSMRQIILDVDFQLLQQHWVGGVGPSRLNSELDARYAEYSRRSGLALETYNTHNEYLHEWLSLGLIGILLFLGILLLQFAKAVRWRHHLYLVLLVILSVTFFTENVLSRQRGVVFYAFFTSLFFISGAAGLENGRLTPKRRTIAEGREEKLSASYSETTAM